jgi:hypothetical protein
VESCILSTTYFGPVQWYQKLYRYDRVLIDQQETFQKQTFSDRCLIATTQGILALTVPVVHGSDNQITSIGISDHGNWRHLHWQALQSAYGDSPFFEYYEDDIRPFFTERNWERLVDYNDAICRKMCELLDIQPNYELCTMHDELTKAKIVCDELIKRGINIAESYEDYLKLGFALANGLGKDGHDIYHLLCSQSSKYRKKDCEEKWQECLSKNDGQTTIATFYYMAKKAGIDLSAIGW